jgi:hypothetical protein
MIKKPVLTKIQVRCTRPIALEMCRYDGSKIVSEALVDSRFDAVVDRMSTKTRYLTPEEIEHEKEQHRVYDFVVEGQSHTLARWSSFGVIVLVQR